MAFPQRFLDELIANSDIVDIISPYVALTRKGNNYFGLCPFHSEKTGSFSVSPDKQLYYCFGCRKGGGVINFVEEIENLSYPDAIRFLAKRANMPVPEEDNANRGDGQRRRRLLALNQDAARWFCRNLSTPAGAPVAAYLAQRRIGRKTAVNFGLGASLNSWDSLMNAMLEKGYTKQELLDVGLVAQNRKGRLYDKFRNRLMFPVIDVRGDVVAFGGRVLDKSEPKYMNTTETIVYSKRKNLYGIHLAKKTKRPNFILCEGNIDVITLHQAGFDNAVASMGTALTTEQAQILRPYNKELVLCYDNDAAGQMATEKNLAMLTRCGFHTRVLQLPLRPLEDGGYGKQDVDDFIKTYGADAFATVLNGSAGQMDYRMNVIAAKYDLTQSDGRIGYATEVIRLIASLPNAVEREIYAEKAAEKAGISPQSVLTDVEHTLKQQRRREWRALERENRALTTTRQPDSRAIRYSDLPSAMAEEGLVGLLFLDNTLVKQCAGITSADFSSPLLGKTYQALLDAHGKQRTLSSPAALAGELTAEEMSHLAGILQKKHFTLSNAEKAVADYIRIIRASSDKRNGTGEADALLAAMDAYKGKKGYGGKRNDNRQR